MKIALALVLALLSSPARAYNFTDPKVLPYLKGIDAKLVEFVEPGEAREITAIVYDERGDKEERVTKYFLTVVLPRFLTPTP